MSENKGFSLIELSIVLVIIASIAGVSMSIGSTQMQVAKINNSQTTLDNAKMALATFKEKVGRLPCPANPALPSTDINYGLEVTGCDLGACPAGVICAGNGVQGAIPHKTINLSESAVYDSWGNKLTYIIDKALTATTTANDNGRIAIMDANGNEIANSPILGKATYVLLSHGSDGKGAYTKDGTLRAACTGSESDVENCDGDAVIISSQIAATSNVSSTANFYEDYMEWENQQSTEATIVTPPPPTTVKYVQLTGSHTWVMAIGDNGNTYLLHLNPLPILNGNDWALVDSEFNNICTIKTNKKLYCTGSNFFGQVGNGTNTSPGGFVEVFGGFNDWLQVSSHWLNTCGLRSNGKIYCWGFNSGGYLGDGTNTNRWIPTEIAGGFNDWVSVTNSGGMVCGLRSNGRLYCWGGVTGNGTNVASNIPVEVAGGFTDWISNESPGCAVRSNGRAYCWGYNLYGQLGDGTTTDRWMPTEIAGGFNDWVSVKIGKKHSCGIRAGGRLYCWGSNDGGQLGDGTISSITPIPVEVAGGFTDWLEVECLIWSSCGRRANGKTYCWGGNAMGQLGDGTTTQRLIPTEVILPTN